MINHDKSLRWFDHPPLFESILWLVAAWYAAVKRDSSKPSVDMVTYFIKSHALTS